MKKRLLAVLLTVLMVAAMLPTTALAAQDYTAADFTKSSWFGEFTGGRKVNGVWVPTGRYVDFTINQCDSSGNFTGSGKVTTVEGQSNSDDDAWCTFDFKGTINFTENTYYMETVRITGSYKSNVTWTVLPFSAVIQENEEGDMTLSGIYNNEPFLATRTSAWARDEMVEASILGLIPETLKDADMTKSVTRAELAAISVKLYESLNGSKAAVVTTPFVDIIGNANRAEIEKAYGLGIVAGISDTEFAPDVAINREQLATMLCRTIKKLVIGGWTLETDGNYPLDTSGVALFADDGNISGFAKPSVYYMVKMKIVSGVDATHFAPKNVTGEQEAKGYATATREQAVAIALRIYKQADTWK